VERAGVDHAAPGTFMGAKVGHRFSGAAGVAGRTRVEERRTLEAARSVMQ